MKYSIIALSVAAVLLFAAVIFLRTRSDSDYEAAHLAPDAAAVESFVTSNGWIVLNSNEPQQIRIPMEFGEIFSRYNELQLVQEMDLIPFKGATAEKYTFTVVRFADDEQLCAEVLVADSKIIAAAVGESEYSPQPFAPLIRADG